MVAGRGSKPGGTVVLRFAGFVVGLLLLLPGCATFPPSASPATLDAWDRHSTQVSAVGDFTLQGRFAAGGVFGTKGQMHWTQTGADYRVRLWGPFGAGAVLISGNADSAEVRTAHEVFQTTRIETELRERFGWTLPVGHLRWWVLGLPSPASRAGMKFDARGRIVEMRQDGWTLEYPEYQAVETLSLPRRLELSNKELGAKLVIDQWQP